MFLLYIDPLRSTIVSYKPDVGSRKVELLGIMIRVAQKMLLLGRRGKNQTFLVILYLEYI